MSPSPERDQTMTSQAIIAITEFLSRYPESRYADEFNDMLDELLGRLMEKSYLNAYTYYKVGRYKSAIVAFKNAIRQHPDSPRLEDMRYYMTVSAYKLAENSVSSKQLDRYLDMLDHYYTFIAEYPEATSRIKELERMAKNARNFIDKNRKTSDNE
jgi:outer membrane protein assembly factor BamD